MSRKITSREFAAALQKVGIIDDPSCVRRIVVDAEAGCALRVYVEYIGDEGWLNVAQALDGIEVTTAGDE